MNTCNLCLFCRKNENHMIRWKFKEHMDEYSKLEAQLWTQILSLILSTYLTQNKPKPADEYYDQIDTQLNILRGNRCGIVCLSTSTSTLFFEVLRFKHKYPHEVHVLKYNLTLLTQYITYQRVGIARVYFHNNTIKALENA